MSAVSARLQGLIGDAMKAGDKPQTAILRLLLAAVKQTEIDRQVELDDGGLIAVVEKMIKQRRDSIAHYDAAGRDALAAQERAEIESLTAFLPTPLSEAEVITLVDEAIAATGAADMSGMGKIIAALKPQVAGKFEMSALSKIVREKLSG